MLITPNTTAGFRPVSSVPHMRNLRTPLTEEEVARIRKNALDATARSITSDLVSLLLPSVEDRVRRSLETADTGAVLTAAENGMEEFAHALRPKLPSGVPAELLSAVHEFCTASPREMEELVTEVSRYVCGEKAGIRAVIRELEGMGAIKNLGDQRRHRWVAADSRWGAPSSVPLEE